LLRPLNIPVHHQLYASRTLPKSHLYYDSIAISYYSCAVDSALRSLCALYLRQHEECLTPRHQALLVSERLRCFLARNMMWAGSKPTSDRKIKKSGDAQINDKKRSTFCNSRKLACNKQHIFRLCRLFTADSEPLENIRGFSRHVNIKVAYGVYSYRCL